MIDIEKFICSLIEKTGGLNTHVYHCDLLNALKAQGLEYKNGEIVKTQRRIAAEAKEALYTAEVDSDDDRIRKMLIELVKGYSAFINGQWRLGDFTTSELIAWLEKHCKQKSINDTDEEIVNVVKDTSIIDMVEPKFKVGDWVICIGATAKILDLQKHCYVGKDVNDKDFVVSYYNECEMKKWSIQDAKDGDVLVDKYGNIGIYQGNKNAVMWNSYCYCGVNKAFYDEGSHEFPCYPATKEQRDTLMKAMDDAGYTFDFKKKELKEIEDELEIPFGANDSELQEVTYYIPKGFHAEIDDDNVVIKKGEKSAAWSEDDENMYRMCVDAVEYYHNPEDESVIRDWLKSLKDRIAWKPNKKQIHAFELVYEWYNNNFAPSETLTSLYNDLKKL